MKNKNGKRILKKYKVHTGGKKWEYFETLEDARKFCNEVQAKTGTVLTVLETPVKDGKRILEVTIRRIYDESPDTSYLGEFSDTPEGDFSIDRATDEFQGDIDRGTDWLQRIEARLEELRDEESHPADDSQDDKPFSEWDAALTAAIDTIIDLRQGQPFNVEWDRREYRYFNPGTVEGFKLDADWIPSELKTKHEREAYWREQMRKNARMDYDRMNGLTRGDWYYIGIRAEAEIGIGDIADYPKKFNVTVQRITSGGLWGIESDSDKSYFAEVEQQELADLKTQLLALCFSKRAISKAFQNVKRKDN